MSSAADSPDRQKAKTFFQYGNDATLKSNLDYAIDMYKQACRLAPDNLTYRQALRGVQRRKFNNDPAKVGMLVGAAINRSGCGRDWPDRRVSMPTLWTFVKRRSLTIPGT